VPIAIDGMVIEPGDLIVGDDDGLLCIPFVCGEPGVAANAANEETLMDVGAAVGALFGGP
jgi:regulator of RNase E activity RraA